MLSKTPTPSPAMSSAFPGHRTVRVAAKLRCPHCGRELQASDVGVARHDIVLICQGCHRDVLTIERETLR